MSASWRKPLKRYVAQTRLSVLAARPGGKSRDQAVADAERSIESIRGACMAGIEEQICELEALVAGCQDPMARLARFARLADRLVSLSGTFGLDNLADAGKRLCDMACAFQGRGIYQPAPIAVCVFVIRLFAPSGAALSPRQASAVLGELTRLLRHLRIAPASEPALE